MRVGLRLMALALVGAAAAAAAAAVTARPARIAAAPRPVPIHVAAPATVSGRSAVRCFASARRASPYDARVAHLVAPVTTVHRAYPSSAQPALGGPRRVFPLLGPRQSVADTFGAAREAGLWHHGDDLFAPRGTPVVAAADGVVFSLGWQRLGGKRLWLIDGEGNEYYYAHLERYARPVRDGRRVAAGTVLGYVGTTGDAEGTPPHLHFEIHPARLLRLGYDGAVDPTRYLRAWSALRHGVTAIPRVTLRHVCAAGA